MPKQSATDNGGLAAFPAIGGTESTPRLVGILGAMPGPLRIAAVGTAAFGLVVLAAAVARPLGAVVGVVLLLALARWRPALLLALALNGFFVYLAATDLSGQSRATAAYDAALGAALLVAAWRGRRLLLVRALTPDWAIRGWILAAAALAIWFVTNGLVYRVGGHGAKVVLGEFVAVTIPSVLLVFSLDRAALREFFLGLVLLGAALVVADVVALARGASLVDGRFTPLGALDPISAGVVPAVAATALLTFNLAAPRRRVLQGVLLASLVAAVIIPGSRGPVALLAAALLVALACKWQRRRLAVVALAVVVGSGVAWAAATWVGSSAYLTQGTGSGAPLSTVQIREYWVRSAISAVPDKLWLGHGLVSLPDNSPQAYLMHVNGQLVYPHNDIVEAIYSLGVLGFVLFLLALVGPAVLARRNGPAYAATVLFVGAFVEANFSGEIGADALFWVAAALLVVSRADRARVTSPALPSIQTMRRTRAAPE